MSSGSIKVAESGGVFVIKMAGDVRLTLCLAFDRFIDSMLHHPQFSQVVFDLNDAHAIDSTTLGLMAKISIETRRNGHPLPLVVSNNQSITRLLVSMGFEDIFCLVDESSLPPEGDAGLENLRGEPTASEAQVRAKVLEAHRLLMTLNETNRETFRELVDTLQNDG